MDRFVVFISDDQSPSSTQQIDAWTKALMEKSASWIEIHLLGSLRACVLKDRHGQVRSISSADAAGNGLVIGTLFERGHGRKGSTKSLTPRDIRFLAEGGQSGPTGSYWGDFTAIWRVTQDRRVDIYRDPCGSTSCFRLRTRGIDILFSHLPDVVALPGIELAIDWTSIQAFLVHNYFITKHTGFREVREILPGEQVVLQEDEEPISRWPWNPADIASQPHRHSFEEAVETLRTIATDCFGGWGSEGGHIAVRLSGGLDSSIVMQLARQCARKKITALHVRGRGYETQDLAFARMGASHAGVELVEIDPPASLFDVPTLIQSPLLPRPCSQLLGAAVDGALANACASLNVQSVMSGNGGDSLFLQRGIARDALSDYVRLNGLTNGLVRTAYEYAVLQQTSVWSVLSRFSAHALGLRKWAPYQALYEVARRSDDTSVARSIDELPSAYVLHPCLREAMRLPPCKASQVSSILALRNYHSQLSLGIHHDAIEPLVSQPIVEFCLQTPAYLFSDGAVDRALERRAFAGLLPTQIANRFQKGFVNHQVLHDVSQSLGALREFLLDGQLIATGITTRRSVETMLSQEATLEGSNLPAILNLLAVEAWLASYANARAAAP